MRVPPKPPEGGLKSSTLLAKISIVAGFMLLKFPCSARPQMSGSEFTFSAAAGTDYN